MPLPLLLAAAALPALYKGIKGFSQGREAELLQQRDTTPPAFREALGLGRQAQTAQLPGLGTQLNRIEAGTNDTLQAATRAGTSGSSVLGLLGVADQNRQRALADIGARTDANQQVQNSHLQGLLREQAGYQLRDRQEFDRNRAALKQAADANKFGALSDLSQVGVYGLGKMAPPVAKGLENPLIQQAGRNLAAVSGTIVTGPDDVLNRRARHNKYGVLDYPLSFGSDVA
jgi:hypothetical protein